MDHIGVEGGAAGRPGVTAEQKRERRKIQSLVSRAGVPSADVDDVTQEVMIAIARSTSFSVPPGMTREEAREAWTCGVVRVQVIRYRSGQAQRAAEQVFAAAERTDPEAGPVVPSAEERALLREDVASALEVLARLDHERRAIFVAYEIEEEAMVDVARAMGLKLNTAWNLLRLAREELRLHTSRLPTSPAHRLPHQGRLAHP